MSTVPSALTSTSLTVEMPGTMIESARAGAPAASSDQILSALPGVSSRGNDPHVPE